MTKYERYQAILRIEAQVRASIAYARWREKNLKKCCDKCGTDQLLECHHFYLLKTIIGLTLDELGSEDDTLAHMIQAHEDNSAEVTSRTLCQSCHKARHPSMKQITREQSLKRATAFCVIPRALKEPLCYSLKTKLPDSLGVFSLRLMIVFGWYILNGQVEGRMITVTMKELSDKMEIKYRGSSWMKCLTNALNELTKLNILAGHAIMSKNVELHFHPDYLAKISHQPWFVPMDYAACTHMFDLALRIHLSYYRTFKKRDKKRKYKIWRIGMTKFMSKDHLGVQDTRMDHFWDRIEKACKKINWITKVVRRKDCLTFHFKNKGAIPVHSLRQLTMNL